MTQTRSGYELMDSDAVGPWNEVPRERSSKLTMFDLVGKGQSDKFSFPEDVTLQKYVF